MNIIWADLEFKSMLENGGFPRYSEIKFVDFEFYNSTHFVHFRDLMTEV